MSKGEFGEPWYFEDGEVYTVDDDQVLTGTFCGARLGADWRDRAIACVNALAGRDPAAIEQRLAERDELLAAAKGMLIAIDKGGPDLDRDRQPIDDAYDLAKAAIAKAEGG